MRSTVSFGIEAAFAEAHAANAGVQRPTFETGEPQARDQAILAKRKGRG